MASVAIELCHTCSGKRQPSENGAARQQQKQFYPPDLRPSKDKCLSARRPILMLLPPLTMWKESLLPNQTQAALSER